MNKKVQWMVVGVHGDTFHWDTMCHLGGGRSWIYLYK